jgi:creatinine deaminase
VLHCTFLRVSRPISCPGQPPNNGLEPRRYARRIQFLLTIMTPYESQQRGFTMDEFMRAAIEEAKQGLSEGGIPIGSVLVIDGEIVGRGHNRRVQKGSAILHAEMDCLENTGRLKASEYKRATLYTTLSPCDMCSGTVLLYKIPRVIIGENRTFRGPEDYLRSRGVELEILDDSECISLMTEFIRDNPDLWNEDIGE